MRSDSRARSGTFYRRIHRSSLMSSYKFFKEKATLNVLPLSNCKQNEGNLVLEKTRTRVAEGTTLQSCNHSTLAEIQAQVNIGVLRSYIHACLHLSFPLQFCFYLSLLRQCLNQGCWWASNQCLHHVIFQKLIREISPARLWGSGWVL